MNSWLGVNPVFQWWLIVSVTLLLLCFFAYKEYSRNQKFLIARMIGLTLMMISVLGILLRPYISSSEIPPPAILLTEGYSKSQADSVVAANRTAKIFATTNSEKYPEATFIDPNEVGIIENLRFVLGNGLPADVLQLLRPIGFMFLSPAKSKGITHLYVPQMVRPHELSTIRGVADPGKGSSIELVGPAGIEDSTRIDSKTGEFELRFKPRQAGLFLYSAIIKEKSMTQTNRVPIEVKSENKLNVLFLQKFPTAETRTLKNYLAEKGHAVALRYQVSKTNFKYEYSNLAPQALNRLTPELLTSFDLLFVDNYLFEEIGSGEKDAIAQAIRKGLGVIIFVEHLSGPGNVLNTLIPVKAEKARTDTVHLKLEKMGSYTLPAIPIAVSHSLRLQPVLQTRDRVMSGYVYSGYGKVGFQLLRETYRLQLKGDADAYSFIWRELVERTARMKQPKFKIVLKSSFPHTVGESIQVDVLSDGSQPYLVADGGFVPLEEDVLLDDVWHGKIWATAAGWHAFKVKNDSSTVNYFVSDSSEWKTLRQVRQRLLNNVHARGAITPAYAVATTKPIDPLIWYGLFLVSAGFLWLAPKL